MTPDALLICLTIVANLDNGSVVNRECHYEMPKVAILSQSVEKPAVIAVSQVSATVTAPVVVAAASAPIAHDAEVHVVDAIIAPTPKMQARRRVRNVMLHHAKVHYAQARKTVGHEVTAQNDKSFRFSWYERMAAK